MEASQKARSGLSSSKPASQSTRNMRAIQNRHSRTKHSEPELKKTFTEKSHDINSDLEPVGMSDPNLTIRRLSNSNESTSEKKAALNLVQLKINKEIDPAKSSKFKQTKGTLESRKTNTVEPKKPLDFLQTTELLKSTEADLASGKKVRTKKGLVVNNLHTVDKHESYSGQQTMMKNLNAIKFQDFDLKSRQTQSSIPMPEKESLTEKHQDEPDIDFNRTQATANENKTI